MHFRVFWSQQVYRAFSRGTYILYMLPAHFAPQQYSGLRKAPSCILFSNPWSMIISWIGLEHSWAKSSSGFSINSLPARAPWVQKYIAPQFSRAHNGSKNTPSLNFKCFGLVLGPNPDPDSSLSGRAWWAQRCWPGQPSLSVSWPIKPFLWPGQPLRRKWL